MIRVMDREMRYLYIGDSAPSAVNTFMESAPGARTSYEIDPRGGIIVVGGDPEGRVLVTIYGISWDHFKILRDRWRRQHVQ